MYPRGFWKTLASALCPVMHSYRSATQGEKFGLKQQGAAHSQNVPCVAVSSDRFIGVSVTLSDKCCANMQPFAT